MAIVICCVYLLLLPLGPPLGVLHFVASCCEGLAHILLHEEAQFAPFEPQRTIESEAWNPYMETQETSFRASMSEESLASAESTHPQRGTSADAQKRKWFNFVDDDEAIDMIRGPVAQLFHS